MNSRVLNGANEVIARRPASEAADRRANRSLVGGVNSPVRAFGAVGGRPVAVARADGVSITDIDGNRYIDFVGSWGPAIVGHANPRVLEAVHDAVDRGLSFGAPCEAETELAETILGALPGHDRIRFVSSGTEACMSAVRLARAATGRDLIVKFAGNYHGHADAMLVEAGSGAITHGVPTSPGINKELARSTLTCRYNDAEDVSETLRAHEGRVAAVLVEPVAGNMGLVAPADGFLEALRDLCSRHGTLLIFDEVMTGFRVAWGGYQVICGIQPDLTCLGKVIGGGLPAAAYAGRRELMDLVAPVGPVYQAGTLSGNPVAMAAGRATLEICQQPGFYESLSRASAEIVRHIRESAARTGHAVQTDSIGGMIGVSFAQRPPRNFEDAKACDHDKFGRFFHAALDRGVWLPPSGYEAWFVSAAHGPEEVSQACSALDAAFGALG
ncbi:MAG: glutamate-1-semialdehyde 2,1-aminomutase [Planctomycetota bacterium]